MYWHAYEDRGQEKNTGFSPLEMRCLFNKSYETPGIIRGFSLWKMYCIIIYSVFEKVSEISVVSILYGYRKDRETFDGSQGNNIY